MPLTPCGPKPVGTKRYVFRGRKRAQLSHTASVLTRLTNLNAKHPELALLDLGQLAAVVIVQTALQTAYCRREV